MITSTFSQSFSLIGWCYHPFLSMGVRENPWRPNSRATPQGRVWTHRWKIKWYSSKSKFSVEIRAVITENVSFCHVTTSLTGL